MITENLSTLKIHKLTQAQYNRELAAGRIDENALYLTPDEERGTNITTKTTTLPAAGWANLFQTVSVDGVDIDNTIVVTPAPTSHAAYVEAGVYCSAQADGTLTFACSETPVVDLTVNVLILN